MNKTSTITDYHERINKVLLYINTHLGEKLDLETLASISNFSIYHFHRIMRAHINQSLADYILRVRMDAAAHLLTYTKLAIQDISIKVGYENVSSFSRAFKKRFFISPNEFRNNVAPAKMNEIGQPATSFLEFELKPKFKYKPQRKIAYVNAIGGYGSDVTQKVWETLVLFAKKNKLFGRKTELFGVSYDNPIITEAEKCRYDACIVVNKNVEPEGEVHVREIPEGNFAVFKFKGDYDNFNYVYTKIYRDWLPTSGKQLRDDNPYEKYLNHPGNTKPERLMTEIYIPIK